VRIIIFFILVCTTTSLSAQIDSTSLLSSETLDVNTDASPTIRSPKRALLYAALIPGGGQIYNRNWIKLPFLYGGYSFFMYRALDARTDFLCHDQALKAFLNENVDNPGTPYPCRGRTYTFEGFTATGYRAERDSNRQSMELNFIFTGLLHIASIIDAYVYAHLDSFDTDDDLSLRLITPERQMTLGLENLPRMGLVYSF